ncbi:DDE superfamily endonuclease [Pseudoscourfieldia marina]
MEPWQPGSSSAQWESQWHSDDVSRVKYFAELLAVKARADTRLYDNDLLIFITFLLTLYDDDEFMRGKVYDVMRSWGGSQPGRIWSTQKWLNEWMNVEMALARMTDTAWRSQHGVSKQLFRKLVADLQDELAPCTRSLRAPVPVAMAVSMTLMRLRLGTACSSIATYFGVGASTAHKYILLTLTAIAKVYEGRVIYLPKGDEMKADMQLIEAKGSVVGIGWALDGTDIPVRARSVDVVAKRNRKGVVSDRVLLLANDDLIIRWAQIGMPGSAADGRAFALSSLETVIRSGTWPGTGADVSKDVLGVAVPPQILVDAAFAASKNTLRPFEGAELDADAAKQEYNFLHSSLRMLIERLNGVLKRRFGTLNKPAEWWEDNPRFLEINACLIVHNLARAGGCRDYELTDEELELLMQDRDDEHVPGDVEESSEDVASAASIRAALCSFIALSGAAKQRYDNTAPSRHGHARTHL